MQQRTRGFTLVELIVSITLVGILAVVAVPLVRTPMAAYMDATRRADLTGELDASVARMRDDLAQALPNSIRVRQVAGGRYFLEFLQVRASGRYRIAKNIGAPSCPATCSVPNDNDVLDFNV
jgi:MSHA biogenesis protein MshO